LCSPGYIQSISSGGPEHGGSRSQAEASATGKSRGSPNSGGANRCADLEVRSAFLLRHIEKNLAFWNGDFGHRGAGRLLDGFVVETLRIERILDELIDRKLRGGADIDPRTVFKNQIHPRIRPGDNFRSLLNEHAFLHSGSFAGGIDHLGGLALNSDDADISDNHGGGANLMDEREGNKGQENELKDPGVHSSAKVLRNAEVGKGKFVNLDAISHSRKGIRSARGFFQETSNEGSFLRAQKFHGKAGKMHFRALAIAIGG
jgi:hypothetical protein